jgi:hypothetical protein
VIDESLIDRLIHQVDARGLELLGPDGALTELTSRILFRGLEVELTSISATEKGDPAGWGSGNYRNGSRSVTWRERNSGRTGCFKGSRGQIRPRTGREDLTRRSSGNPLAGRGPGAVVGAYGLLVGAATERR